MTLILNRRNIYSLAILFAMSIVFAACSDNSADSAVESKKTASDSQKSSTAKTVSQVKVPEPTGTVDMAKLLQPGKLKDMAMGKPDAPVTIIEYASMTCPHCAHFTETVLPIIKEKYIDPGKVRWIFRDFPSDTRALAASMLLRCAPEERYFPFLDVLFKQQQQWAVAADAKILLLQLAKLAGFTQESFNACLTNQQLLDDVHASYERGSKELGIDATPTLFINGKKYVGALSVDEISAILDSFF